MTSQVLTNNVDIDYVVKDFYSTIDALISYANVTVGPGTQSNRLWTDFNKASFSRTWLELVAYVADILYYYFDQQATQSYLQTATIESAVLDIAQQFGFIPSSATSASGVVTFTVIASTVIPRGFRVKATNGAEFYVTTDIIVPVGVFPSTVLGNVLQGVVKTEGFTSLGLQNEEFDLAGPNVIRDFTNIIAADKSPILTVSGNVYTLVDSFIQFNAEDSPVQIDSIGNITQMGGRVFTLGKRPNDIPFIRFGDGIFGRKLNPGEVINIIYRTGGGTIGNIEPNNLNALVSVNSAVTGVNNNNKFSGGIDAQTIDQIKSLIPASLRTLQRAVAIDDYSDLILVNFPEVLLASTELNTTDFGIDLNIYVVPQGSGIPQISDNPTLKSNIFKFVDKRKTVTVQFQLLDAFGIDVVISLIVNLSDSASRTAVAQSIQSTLLNFFSLQTGGVDGLGVKFVTPILFKDIVNLIEVIPGVERFEISELSYHPRIVSTVVGLTAAYTDQPVMIYPSVSESEWLLASEGVKNETLGTGSEGLYSNTALVPFTYTSISGLLQYNPAAVVLSFIDLSNVGPEDLFKDSSGIEFAIHAVDYKNFSLILDTGLTVDTSGPATSADGSIRDGGTTYQAYRCFKKTLATITSFSYDNFTTIGTITDSDLNLTKYEGIGVATEAHILLDTSKAFVVNELIGGKYILLDSDGNTWAILANDSNSIRLDTTALNNAGITSVVDGNYSIFYSLENHSILLNGNIYSVTQPYNNSNTVYCLGVNFPNIGNISNNFQISKLQSNLGAFGMAVDISSYVAPIATITSVAGASYFDLQGVNGKYVLIDKNGIVFKIAKVDDSTGTKTLTLETNLVPALGVGASLVPRYYDDNDEISVVVGIKAGAAVVPDGGFDADDYGKSTVGGISNRNVDHFVFRTSKYVDDIINFRLMEVPQLDISDIIINLVGGI
jgi:hypothetical protein